MQEILNYVPANPSCFDIRDQVNSVEAICIEYDMTPKLQIPVEVDTLLNNIHLIGTSFPLLEVDEIGQEDSTCLHLEDEYDFVFKTVEELSAHNVDLELCCKDLLVSEEINLLEHIFDSHSSKLLLDFEFTSLIVAHDFDLLQVIEAPCIEKSTGLVNTCLIPFVQTLLFEEFNILDSDSFDIFEALDTSQIYEDSELCNMFHGDMLLRNFDELIVSSELAIIDGTFTSLSVPDLSNYERIWSLHVLADKIFTELEPVSLSTSDEIYLDWHLLGRDEYKDNVNAAIEKVFDDIEDYTMCFNLESDDESMLVLDFLLSNGTSDRLDTSEKKLTIPCGVSFTAKRQNDEVASVKLQDEDCQIIENTGNITDAGFDRSAFGNLSDLHKPDSSFQSMCQVNELDFFLNPKKASGDMRTGHKFKPLDAKSMFPSVPHMQATVPSSSSQIEEIDVQMHRVILPANMNILVDKLRRNYMEILREAVQLSNTELSTSFNEMNLLELSEEKILDLMHRTSERKSLSGHVVGNVLDFVALCAIKRITWCLCFCGIHCLHLFLCKLLQSLDSLKPRLSFLYSLIDDAYRVVEKEVIKSHPSLATLKTILLKNDNRQGRVLIVAQQVLSESLKRLLNSMNLSFAEVDLSTPDVQPDLEYDFIVASTRDQIQTCLLVPHE